MFLIRVQVIVNLKSSSTDCYFEKEETVYLFNQQGCSSQGFLD